MWGGLAPPTAPQRRLCHGLPDPFPGGGRRLGAAPPAQAKERIRVRQRRIGSTDLLASEVGLAVWSLVAGRGARSDEDAADLLAAALDLGVSYFPATDRDDGGPAEG